MKIEDLCENAAPRAAKPCQGPPEADKYWQG
jgi:hypothetical protein